MGWLPKAEQKLTTMDAIAADPRSIRIQIEEMKVRVQDKIKIDGETYHFVG